MNRNRFSEEQMSALAANPYTKAVFPTTLKFTDEFKAEFLRLYNQGCLPREIFVKLGYDPKMIGESRMSNTAYLISQSQKKTGDKGDELARLEGEVRALRKELDTLKKLLHWRTRGSQVDHDEQACFKIRADSGCHYGSGKCPDCD